jgi:hypothetical protein
MYGWHLIKRVAPHASAGAEQRVVAANDSLRYGAGPGVDRLGRLIDPANELGAFRVVAFLIRESSLAADVVFWTQVANLVRNNSGVRFVAYCDGDQCLASLDRIKRAVPFTVIGYAGMIDAQALINADGRGEFLIKDLTGARSLSRLPWRGAMSQRPASVARIVTP